MILKGEVYYFPLTNGKYYTITLTHNVLVISLRIVDTLKCQIGSKVGYGNIL